MIGGRLQAGDQPHVGNENPEVRVIGDDGTPRRRAVRSDHHAVGPCPADARQDPVHIVGSETRQRRTPTFHQTRPQLRPVRPLPQRQQTAPYQPVHIRAHQPADSKDIGDGPRFTVHAENAVFLGQVLERLLIVVDSVDKPLCPAPRNGIHRRLDVPGRVSKGENAQTVVDVTGEGACHFGEAASGRHAHQTHLGETQMSVDHAQSEGSVVVAHSLDERNLVVVPVDCHPAVEIRPVVRKDAQTLRQTARFGKRRQEGARGQGTARDEKAGGTDQVASGVPSHERRYSGPPGPSLTPSRRKRYPR